MRHIVRRAVALLALATCMTAALWVGNAPRALACSCEQVSEETLERGAAVVVGVVTRMAEVPAEWEGQQRFVAEVTVQADRKNNLDDVIYVTSERDDGGNCGVSWQPGTRIAAVLYEDSGVLRTDACGGMQPALAEGWQPADATAAVQQLGSGFGFSLEQPDPPRPTGDDQPESGDDSNALVWAGVIGVAIGITIAVVRGKRK